MNKKAFTLIELLVVVAVAGMLVAILVPALGSAREGARRAQCANNLRQIGIAWYLYLDDNNETFPVNFSLAYGGRPALSGDLGANWDMPASQRPLNPYLDIYSDNDPNMEIFECPSNGAIAATGYGFEWRGNSYPGNSWLLGAQATTLSAITTPHSKLVVASDQTSPRSPHGGTYPRQKVNVLFLDGHVKMHHLDDDINNGALIYLLYQ